MDERKRLQELLLEKSYRKGTVKLSSGKMSDFYIDGKQTTLDAEGAYLCGKLLFEMIRSQSETIGGVGGNESVFCVATPRTAFELLARSVADASRRGYISGAGTVSGTHWSDRRDIGNGKGSKTWRLDD